MESRSRGSVCIMKEISVRSWSERDQQLGRNEIEILRSCHHQNVVQYMDHFYEQSKFLIVMEFCDGGDLAGFIKRQRRHLTEAHVMDWFKQMASGLCYIHSRNILHRDLKPANIFLTSKQELKIGDFGISKSLERARDMAKTYCGTPVYMAPEIVAGKLYNEKVDVWALGCVLFELCTLKLAFSGANFMYAISKGEYDHRSLEKHYSVRVSAAVAAMLRTNPKDRPSAEQVMQGNVKEKDLMKPRDDKRRHQPKKVEHGDREEKNKNKNDKDVYQIGYDLDKKLNISPSPYQGFGKDEHLDLRGNPPIFPGIGEKKLWDESPGRLDFNVGRQANGFHDHWKISPGFDAFGRQPGRMQGDGLFDLNHRLGIDLDRGGQQIRKIDIDISPDYARSHHNVPDRRRHHSDHDQE